MPDSWMKSGIGFHLCSLSEKELEGWALRKLRPAVDAATKADGDYTVADENLINFMFKRSTLKKKIMQGAEKAFDILIPKPHQALIFSVRNLVEWLVQRVEIARPKPSYQLPQEVDIYLEMWNRKRIEKELAAAATMEEHKQKTSDPFRDNLDWKLPKQSPDSSGWLNEYVKKQVDRMLVAQARKEELKLEEAKKKAARDATAQMLAERKAKAAAMRAVLQKKDKENEKTASKAPS
jgi:hypothetical protein